MKTLRLIKNNRMRPQNGTKLRELREALHLRQAEFAEKVNEHMRVVLPNLPAAEILTQTMVSDLELGYAELGVLHLLAISNFFGVMPVDLLSSDLKLIDKTEIDIQANIPLVCDAVHPYFCKTSDDDRVFVFPKFPSGFFTSSKCVHCDRNNVSNRWEYIEFYPLESLLDFLFSPIGFDGRQEKLQVLERMLAYFKASIYRHLYFIPRRHYSRIEDACVHISPTDGVVTFLFPDSEKGISFVNVNNQKLADMLHTHYRQEVVLMRHGLMLLEAAYSTLLVMDERAQMESIQLFYQKCLVWSECAVWVKECFTPEVRQCLVDV